MTFKKAGHILGLSSQGEEISDPPKKHVPELFNKYTLKDSTAIYYTHMKAYFKDNESYDDNFVRLFVLFCIGFYLCPTLQTYVKSDCLGLIEDIDNIKNLNWSSLVVNYLIKSIREYKEQKATNLKGNLALLQVWYWEKVSISHMYPTLQQPAGDEPPLMQYWDETRARERCKLGRNHPFGEGKIVDDITSPQCHTTAEQPDMAAQPDMTNARETESNSKDMHELKFKLLSSQMDGRFNALEKRLDVIEGQRDAYHFKSQSNQMDDRFNALEKRLGVIEEQHEARRVEKPKIDMIETSDTDIGNDEMNAKEEDKEQPNKKGTSSKRPNRQKKSIQETNIDYEYNIATKRPRSNKNKDKQQVQDAVPMPYQPHPDESTSQEYLINAGDMPTVEYINSASMGKLLFHIGQYTTTREDLDRLILTDMWLNDSVMNSYIRILKAQPSIKKREGGSAYLELTYLSTQICQDTVASLQDQDETSFRLKRTLTYLKHEMVYFPINIKNTHWYLMVINGPKGAIQILDSKGTATRRPQVQQLLKGCKTVSNALQSWN